MSGDQRAPLDHPELDGPVPSVSPLLARIVGTVCAVLIIAIVVAAAVEVVRG